MERRWRRSLTAAEAARLMRPSGARTIPMTALGRLTVVSTANDHPPPIPWGLLIPSSTSAALAHIPREPRSGSGMYFCTPL